LRTVARAPEKSQLRIHFRTGLLMKLSQDEVSRIIEMAWEDRTPFEAIKAQFGMDERQVITIMRRTLKPASFRLWRHRVSGRRTKHSKLRSREIIRAYCPTQYKHR
jgi:uncharacterized protein (TIGR03643 family)